MHSYHLTAVHRLIQNPQRREHCGSSSQKQTEIKDVHHAGKTAPAPQNR